MNQKKTIYALGVGHNTPVFIDLAEACGYEIAGLYHYAEGRTGELDHGMPIIGSFADLFSAESLEGMEFLLTMGDNRIRAELSERIRSLGGTVPTLIHPTAVISRFATISPVGVYISPFTYIQADTTIAENTILLSHVNISHTNTIGRNCFIAGGSTVGAYTVIEDNVFIGQGALTISGKVKRIGENAYIGARSLITKDVDAYMVVSGSPARVLRRIDE